MIMQDVVKDRVDVLSHKLNTWLCRLFLSTPSRWVLSARNTCECFVVNTLLYRLWSSTHLTCCHGIQSSTLCSSRCLSLITFRCSHWLTDWLIHSMVGLLETAWLIDWCESDSLDGWFTGDCLTDWLFQGQTSIVHLSLDIVHPHTCTQHTQEYTQNN